MDERDVTDDLAFARELADVAAAVTLPWFGRRLPVELKDDATPVTAVDRAAEDAIRAHVAAHRPGDGVLGEEGGHDAGTNDRRWIVDPLDGTKLYAHGVPLWTTLIALQVAGETVLGLADAPAIGHRYEALAGAGAWRGDARLRVSTTSHLSEAFVAHSPVEEWIGAGDANDLLRVSAGARLTRGLSDAWGQLLVAQGSVDAMLEHEPCYLWDWSATRVIVEESGGRITTLTGAPPAAGSDLLVSNGDVHEEVLAALADRDMTPSRSAR